MFYFCKIIETTLTTIDSNSTVYNGDYVKLYFKF